MNVFTPVIDLTPASRIADRVVAGLCLLGALLYPFRYGVSLTFGMLGFYVAIQSGVLHAVRFAAERHFPPTVRFATAGLAMGVCFSVHAFVRGVHGDAYSEYVGGPPVEELVDGVVIGLNHVVIPLASLVHLRGVPVVNPFWPMLLTTVELAAVALLHELLVPDHVVRVVDDGVRKGRLFLSVAISAAAWTLLFETLNRFFFSGRR